MYSGNKPPQNINSVPLSGSPISIPLPGSTGHGHTPAPYRANSYGNSNNSRRAYNPNLKQPYKSPLNAGAGGGRDGFNRSQSQRTTSTSSSKSYSQPSQARHHASTSSGPNPFHTSKVQRDSDMMELDDEDVVDLTVQAGAAAERRREKERAEAGSSKGGYVFGAAKLGYEAVEEDMREKERLRKTADRELKAPASLSEKIEADSTSHRSALQERLKEGRKKREADKARMRAEERQKAKGKGKEKDLEPESTSVGVASFFASKSIPRKSKEEYVDIDNLGTPKSGKKKKKTLNNGGVAPSKSSSTSVVAIDISSSPEKSPRPKKKKSRPRISSSPPAPILSLADLAQQNLVDHEKALSQDKEARRAMKEAKKKEKKDRGEMSEIESSANESGEDERAERLLRDRERDRELSLGLEGLMDEDEDPLDPSLLCPFCSKTLPESPSDRLLSLKSFLLDKPGIKPNPSRRNPLGMRLPITETASFCKRHEEEKVIIPQGLKRGWPREIDWTKFEKRIVRETDDHLMNIINGKKESEFFKLAKDEWEKHGARKMANALSDWGSFDLEQPGYYGPRGFEIMMGKLRKSYVDDTPVLRKASVAPLDPISFIRRVLIPECAVELIRVDQNCSREEALEIRAESRPYGKAMFNNSKEEEAFMIEMEQREEENAQQRRKQNAKQREEEERKAVRKAMKRKEREAEEAALERAKGRVGRAMDSSDSSSEDNHNGGDSSDDISIIPSKSSAPAPVKRKIAPSGTSSTSHAAKVPKSSSSDGKWKTNLRGGDSDPEGGLNLENSSPVSRRDSNPETSDDEIEVVKTKKGKEKENVQKKAKSGNSSSGKSKVAEKPMSSYQAAKTAAKSKGKGKNKIPSSDNGSKKSSVLDVDKFRMSSDEDN